MVGRGQRNLTWIRILDSKWITAQSLFLDVPSLPPVCFVPKTIFPPKFRRISEFAKIELNTSKYFFRRFGLL
jgi:hypothetical protein